MEALMRRPEELTVGRDDMEIYLIRHGCTKGNAEYRYVGRTDEELLENSRQELRRRQCDMRPVDCVYMSYLKRCVQTAELLFPDQDYLVWMGLEEMDFGIFEYKNYAELNGNSAYQNWLDSGGALPFPEGEGQQAFQSRCRKAFSECLIHAKECKYNRIAFVVHGGTIMSVMEGFSAEKKGFYDWQVSNGCGYLVDWDEDISEIRLHVRAKIEP